MEGTNGTSKSQEEKADTEKRGAFSAMLWRQENTAVMKASGRASARDRDRQMAKEVGGG